MSATPTRSTDPARARRRDVGIAALCGVVVAAMVAMSYAAVPLYSWFCRTTGFAGTTQVATAAPGQVLDRTITVRFDANVGPGLPWRFEPERSAIDLKLGEVVTAVYSVTNLSTRETVGVAGYNVTPLTVGSYFDKINCFCFSEQRLKPGERQEMTVVFYIDPALARDGEQNDLNTITLSYTFYPVREPKPGVVQKIGTGAAGRI